MSSQVQSGLAWSGFQVRSGLIGS